MGDETGRKALVVWFDPATNEVEIDSQGLDCFQVCGMLAVAFEIASDGLPSLAHLDESEES